MTLPARFASIAAVVTARVGSPYAAGQIIRQIDPVMDDGGSIATPGGVDRAPCQVQIDSVAEAMRPEGWTDKDFRFLILAASLGVGSLTGEVPALDTDVVVAVLDGPNAGRWMVSSLSRDAASIGYEGRGRRA